MKNKIMIFATVGTLALVGIVYGFTSPGSKSLAQGKSLQSLTCPLEGTPECPKTNCPLAGTPDCPYNLQDEVPSCCKKK